MRTETMEKSMRTETIEAAALAAIRRAAAAEREYGDASVYGPAVRAVEAAADGE